MRVAAATEAELLLTGLKRHRGGLLSAADKLLKQRDNLKKTERRAALQILRAARQQLEAIEKAIAGEGVGSTLKS